MQNPLEPTPWGGDYVPPPPPPTYPVTSDIPPESPYHRSPQPRKANNSAAGWLAGLGTAALAFVKYGGLLLLKIPALATLFSALVSLGFYSLAFGPLTAVGLVAMLFVHEMGHVIEIRRQGMQATAPIFIPFLGAAIFQRSHPTTAVKQAQIGIAGPIAGTIGATVAFFLYLATGQQVLLLTALIGFGLNLFNMIPVWQLDGSWVLAPVSKWVYVAGYVLVVAAILWLHSILLVLVAVLGLSSLVQRFRQAQSPYYASVPASARWALGVSWFGLVLYLGYMTFQAYTLLNPFLQ
jgi:Zn-dependent protease